MIFCCPLNFTACVCVREQRETKEEKKKRGGNNICNVEIWSSNDFVEKMTETKSKQKERGFYKENLQLTYSFILNINGIKHNNGVLLFKIGTITDAAIWLKVFANIA